MATGKKTNTAAKPKRTGAARAPAKKADLDRRWSILLFGLGLLLVVLAVIPGDAGWAFVRKNILFGAFGLSGWLLGPMVIWWAVTVSLEKPVFPAVIKGSLFMLVASGAALVFSSIDFTDMTFSQVIAAVHVSGAEKALGGGLLSLVFGASTLALLGKIGARILLILFVAVATMVLTGVTPGDIVRFFQRLGDRLSERLDNRAGEEFEAYEDEMAQPGAAVLPAVEPAAPAVPPTAKTNARMAVVDIPLEAGAGRGRQVDIPLNDPVRAGGNGRRGSRVDIPLDAQIYRASHDVDLGPTGPQSQRGLGGADPVEIGPGGTFGKQAVDEAGEFGLGDYEPLVPFEAFAKKAPEAKAPEDGAGGVEGGGNLLLFGEDDPYANLGGANSRLPLGNALDVEYIPKPDMNFDLFEGGGAVTGRETAGAAQPRLPDAPVAPSGVAEPRGPAAGRAAPSAAQSGGDGRQPPAAPPAQPAEAAGEAENLERLLDKAAEVKDGRAESDTRGSEPFTEPYSYPPLSLFDVAARENHAGAREEMRRTAELLVDTLASFGVQTSILDVSRGPSVTRYEVQPQAGVKISRITNLADDIALNLAAAGVRIEAPIPGKPAVGIEVPNKVKSTVPIRGLLESSAFADAESPLSIALGKDIAGDAVVTDLTRMPHLLIAGSTGSGKSVCVNSIIMSFLYKSSPEQVRLILIDPKVVELAEYNGIPHLLIPVVTEPKQAAKALGYATKMMEDRYHLFAEHGVRDITSYNKFARRTGKVETIPHIAIVIDELADLMMVAGKDVENYICRIAQKARAAGMHLIVATQRPSVDVITGLIKANIPSRIAFAVSSQVDSRTILDGAGAEKLLGMGDMLFMPIGANKPVRVQGTFVKDREISKVLSYVKSHASAKYDEEVLSEMEKIALSGAAAAGDDDDEDSADILADATFVSAVEMALDAGEISTSGLQRRLRLGYARAGRLVDQMERMGIVSEPNGSKPRQLLITRQQWQEMVMNASE